jgi:hypothetical protein
MPDNIEPQIVTSAAGANPPGRTPAVPAGTNNAAAYTDSRSASWTTFEHATHAPGM